MKSLFPVLLPNSLKGLSKIDPSKLPLEKGQTVAQLCDEIFPVIFDLKVMPKRVNQADGEDLIQTSASNYYEGVTQAEAEDYYTYFLWTK